MIALTNVLRICCDGHERQMGSPRPRDKVLWVQGRRLTRKQQEPGFRRTCVSFRVAGLIILPV